KYLFASFLCLCSSERKKLSVNISDCSGFLCFCHSFGFVTSTVTNVFDVGISSDTSVSISAQESDHPLSPSIKKNFTAGFLVLFSSRYLKNPRISLPGPPPIHVIATFFL